LDITSRPPAQFFETISNFLYTLKYLTVKSFIIQIPATAIFKNIEYLKITNDEDSAWYDLIMACPNVKELTFLNYKHEASPQYLQIVLTYSKNLKILNFICENDFYASDEFLYIFLDENLGICELNIKAKNVNNEEFYKRIEILTYQTKIKIRCIDL
jgi:hypothetical protein